jgi:hemoglobin-like flavoprotein
MNKTDKEYVDAQIESLQERIEKHIKNLYDDMCNKHP